MPYKPQVKKVNGNRRWLEQHMNDSLIHQSKLNDMSNDKLTSCNNIQRNVT